MNKTKIYIIAGMLIFIVLLIIVDLVLKKSSDKPPSPNTPIISIIPTSIPVTRIPNDDTSAFPTGAAQKEEDFQLKSHPDFYLFRKTPYSTSDFSVTGEFTATPTEHFKFTISSQSNNPQLAKSKAQEWMISQGLTQSQIDSLDIEYK